MHCGLWNMHHWSNLFCNGYIQQSEFQAEKAYYTKKVFCWLTVIKIKPDNLPFLIKTQPSLCLCSLLIFLLVSLAAILLNKVTELSVKCTKKSVHHFLIGSLAHVYPPAIKVSFCKTEMHKPWESPLQVLHLHIASPLFHEDYTINVMLRPANSKY